jgi:serine/threonine-protein kinase
MPTPGGVDASGPGTSGLGTYIDLRPGQVVFQRYVVEEKLGEGGMGAVWRVRHLGLGAERALKLMRPEISADPRVRARFRREGRVMARLPHPGAVIVHDARDEDDVAYIEMEYVRGRSLNHVLSPGEPKPLEWVRPVLEQLCAVLQAAHDRGIVHRDLKPSNLMLVDGPTPGPGQLKVLDFGIAKILSADTEGDNGPTTLPGEACFTVNYASPEQITGGAVDARSDIYSVGVILYEFLTGYRPFSGPSALYDQISKPPPPFASRNPEIQLPGELERLVRCCMAKDPAERPQSADELLQGFLAALPRPESAPVSPVAVPAPGRATRRRKVLIALSAVGIGSVVLAAVFPRPKPADPLPAGFAAPDGVAREDGWPREVVCVANGARYFRSADGLYLPEGYEAEPPPEPVNGWPRAIRRAGGGGRYVRFREGYYLPDGFRAVADGAPAAGQPAVIARDADGTRFVLTAKAYYLPEGYDPEPGAPPVPGRPSAAIVRRRDGARFLWITGDDFEMGALNRAIGNPVDDEDQPPHPERVGGFYLQETEVTNAEMEDYFNRPTTEPADESSVYATAWEDLSGKKPEEALRHPAVGVTHRTAERFAAWVGGRLPTEAEWEYAARSQGRKDRRFVWGDSPLSASDRRLRKVNLEWRGQDFPTRQVKRSSLDRTDQGVFDMAGNVREWCLEPWRPYLAPVGDRSGRTEPPQAPDYVLRGGSFNTPADDALTTRPRRLGPAETDESGRKVATARDVGFRVVIAPVFVPGVMP